MLTPIDMIHLWHYERHLAKNFPVF